MSTRWNFRNRTGRFQACRVNQFCRSDDPMNAACGCADEIVNDLRKRDVREGCPVCTTDVIENASEPDVMQRWGYR